MKKIVFLLLMVFLSSTVFPASLRIITPNGNENWMLDSMQNIMWHAEGIHGNVRLILLKDSTELGIIVRNVAVSSGTFSWKVSSFIKNGKQENAVPGTGYKIRIESLSGNLKDDSDLPFTITASGKTSSQAPLNVQASKQATLAKQIRVTTPNGGEKWLNRETKTIRWFAVSVPEGYSILLLKGSRELGLIADNLRQDQTTYNWKIGDPLLGGIGYGLGDDYRVMVRSKSGDVSDTSDRPFTLTEISQQITTMKGTKLVIPSGSIKVIYPNGGETFYSGDQITVRYQTQGPIDKVYAHLWEKEPSGRVWDRDYSGTFPATGQFLYQIPNVVPAGYPLNHTFFIKIHGQVIKDVWVDDESDSLFLIGHGFDLEPKINDIKLLVKRGDAWSVVYSVLTGGISTLFSDITGLKVKVEFEINNKGHYWPNLPVAIPWNVTLRSGGNQLGYTSGYASLTEIGRPAYASSEIEIPADFSGVFTAIIEADPGHIHENADFFWRNNKIDKSVNVIRK
jgi:hypothetical protein